MNARRLSLGAVRGALVGGGVALSALSGLALIGHFAISHAGVPLGPLTPLIETQLSQRSGTAVTIGGGRLERAGRGAAGPVALILSDVEAAGTGGRLALPDLALGLDTGAILRGSFVPRTVSTSGAIVRIVRTEKGIRVAGGEEALDLARLAERAGERGFESVKITNAAFSYRSEVSGAAFDAAGAEITVRPALGGYIASAVLPVDRGVIEARAAIGRDSRAELTVRHVPAGILSGLIPEAPVRIAGSTLSGEVTLSDLETGGAASFDLALTPGTLTAGRRDIPVKVLAGSGEFDLSARTLTIERTEFAIGGNEGRASGTLDLSGEPQFSLTASTLVLDLPIYDTPRRIARAAIGGGFASGTLEVADLSLTLPDGTGVKGALSLPFAGGMPGVIGTLTGEGASIAGLLALWPDTISPGAKAWVTSNIDGGSITGLKVAADIPPGLIGSRQRLTAPMLDITFGLEDARVTYVVGMPPSVGAKGRIHVTGDSLTVTGGGGTIGDASLVSASFVQPRFAPPRPPAIVAAEMTGAAPALLEVIDAPPLGYLARAQLSPDDFSGEGAFAFRMKRPIRPGVRPEDIEFSGQGRFSGLSLSGLPGGIDLSDGEGSVVIDADAMTITAAIDAKGVPTNGVLIRRLGSDLPSGTPRLSLEAQSDLTPRDADALGLPVRRFVSGTAPAVFTLEGNERFERADVSLDLTRTDLRIPAVGLDKRRGSYGKFDAGFVLPAPNSGGGVRADSLRLATPDVLIEGSAAFDQAGGLISLDLPRVYSDQYADISAQIVRQDGGLSVTVSGAYVDASGFIGRLLGEGRDGDDGALGVPLTFDAEVDRLAGRAGAIVTGFSAAGRHDGQNLAELSLSGRFLDDGRVSFEVNPDADGVGREVRLATDSPGALMTAVFGIDSVSGEGATLDATAIAGGPLTGRFNAEGIILRDAPLVARLLSIGSLDGLADVMNGEGLGFDKLSGAMTFEDGVLGLQDARMTGSALGLSANGEVDLSSRAFDISGAVAPAYGVNSFLGAIPGLGELFVSREGEGVVAFSYGVTGPIGEPTVSVNTLSALAPGVFRRIFEPVRTEKRTPEQLLEAATEAAALREDRSTARSAEALAEEEASIEAGESEEATDGGRDRPRR